MNKNKSAVDEFLGTDNEFSQDKVDILDIPEPESVVEEELKEEEKPLPFHKDPKVMRFIEKEISKRVQVKEEPKPEVKKEDEDDYYVRLIGNDTPEKLAMIREAKSRDERLLQQAEDRAYNRVSKEKQREVDAERKAEEELTQSIDDIEENFNVDLTSKDPVARKARVDFLNFVEKIAPKNGQGEIVAYPDMLSAYETWNETKTKSQPSRAKDLASRSMSRSGDTTVKPQERITFDNIDSFIEQAIKKN